jgi:ABC-type microcin C transport system permease subunit YejE
MSSISSSIAATSKYEQFVDGVMDNVQNKTAEFNEFLGTSEGPKLLETAKSVTAIAASLFIALFSAKIVLLGVCVGAIVQVYSPEQIKATSKNITEIWQKLPFVIQASSIGVTAYTIPAFVPICAGFSLGMYIGGKISPKQLDTIASKVIS